MSQSAAAVVDLEEFRRRRAAAQARAATPATRPAATTAVVPAFACPVYVGWVPVWVVR